MISAEAAIALTTLVMGGPTEHIRSLAEQVDDVIESNDQLGLRTWKESHRQPWADLEDALLSEITRRNAWSRSE